MPKPACVKCRLFFRPKKTGYSWIEGMPNGEGWADYKLWNSDLWECRGCGTEIIVGHGRKPIAIQHEEHFQKAKEDWGPAVRIDDC